MLKVTEGGSIPRPRREILDSLTADRVNIDHEIKVYGDLKRAKTVAITAILTEYGVTKYETDQGAASYIEKKGADKLDREKLIFAMIEMGDLGARLVERILAKATTKGKSTIVYSFRQKKEST